MHHYLHDATALAKPGMHAYAAYTYMLRVLDLKGAATRSETVFTSDLPSCSSLEL